MGHLYHGYVSHNQGVMAIESLRDWWPSSNMSSLKLWNRHVGTIGFEAARHGDLHAPFTTIWKCRILWTSVYIYMGFKLLVDDDSDDHWYVDMDNIQYIQYPNQLDMGLKLIGSTSWHLLAVLVVFMMTILRMGCCTLKSKEWDPGKLLGGFMENLQPF